MTIRRVLSFGFLCLAYTALFFPRRAQADALATCSLTLSNFTITPSAGTIVYDGPWTVEAFAQAQNSLGELSQQYVSTNGTPAVADASVTYATGHGDASDFSSPVTASSSASIPGNDSQQAISAGQADLFNTFTITGGTGSVDVVFSVDLLGSLHVMTDSNGLSATAETIFNLTLDGNSTLFSDHLLSIGPSSDQTSPVSEHLSNTITLQYDTAYIVFAQPDAESMAITVPEPSAFILTLAGCSLLAVATRSVPRRRKSKHGKQTSGSLNKYSWALILPLALVFLATTTHAKYAGGGGNPPSPSVTTTIPGSPGSSTSLTDGNYTYDPSCNIQSGKASKPCPKKITDKISKTRGYKSCETGCKECNQGCPTSPAGSQSTPPGNPPAPPPNPTSPSNRGPTPTPTHGVYFKMNYNSYNADGSRDQLDTGMGYGWTHSYNAFLFTQVGNMFRYDGDGRVTKYTRGAGGKYTSDTGYFEKMVKNPNGTFTITDKFGTASNFAYIPGTPFYVGSPVYRLTSIVDRNGDSNILSYSSGRLTSVSDAYGRSLTYSYNSSNRLVRVTDPLSRTNTFVYDSTGRKLTSMIDPEGKTSQYNYNFMYQLTQATDRDGRITRNAYAAGKPSLMMDTTFNKWFGLNNSTGWAMNTNALSQNQLRLYVPSTTTKSDGRNNVWTYSYNSFGYITQVVAPDGATTTYTYDTASRNLASVTNANGFVTSYKYDAMGNCTNMTDALGNVTRYTYETNFNQVTSMTDPKGRTTTYQYDTRGNRLREVDALGHTNSWTYDTHGNTLSEIDKLGNTTTYQYDAQGNRTNVTDALGNITAFAYDSVGNLISVIDPNGHTTTYQYDGLNRMTKETDAVGGFMRYDYDREGNVTNAVDRNGHTTSYQYDQRQRLTKTTDALGDVGTSTYDGNNNVTSTTDRNGHTTTYQYDVQNRPSRVTDALGNATHTTYDPVGNILSTTNANGQVTTYTYDGLNRRVSTTDADGGVSAYEYDTGGNGGCPTCGATPGSSLITRQTDANGKVTYFKYDDLNRLTKVIRKVGSTNDTINVGVDAVTTYTYDAMGNQLSIAEPDGNTTVYAYDALNRQTNTVTAAGDVVSTTYDGVNNVISRISPNGNATVFFYDALDRPTNAVDNVGSFLQHTYDAVGNVVTETDGNGNSTIYRYDSLDRRTNTVDALGNVTVFRYDSEGNILTNIDREGRVTMYSYDAINRRTNTVDALGNVTQYQYDALGNHTQITDANGNTTQYQYDSLNRRIQETYADSTMRTYAYDAVGNLTNRTDQIGRTTTYVYDDLYRLTQRTYPGGTNDTYGYDLSGRMTNATRGAWVVTYAYDGVNRLTNTTQNGRTITYRYDVLARTVTNTYPGGRSLIYQMDYRERKTRIDDGSSPPPIVQYTYDPGNRILTRAYRNLTTANYTYDSLDRIVSVEHSNTTSRIAGFGYDYDNEGHKKFEQKLHATGDSECYGYDALYRLIDFEVGTLVGSCVTGVVTQTQYGLDPVGNWTNKTTDAVTETRTHNSVNELTAMDSTNLTYDANGNLQNDGVYAYTYDEENRLTLVTRLLDSAVVGQYQYDAMGRRVQKVANPNGSPTTTRYYYDNSRIVEEQDGVGTTLATYVYGNYVDEVLTMDRGGQTYYYHQNTLWSPAAVTDSTGLNVVERYVYDAYGAPTVTDGTGSTVFSNAWGTAHSVIGNPYLYTGRELDEENGLYCYRARYYDTAKGRFLQRDPEGYRDGLNLYEYVKDSPVNATDPDGTHVVCTQVSLEFTAVVGGGGCLMYCEDNCGNWGIYAGLQVTAGVAGGAGLSQITLPGVEYAEDVEGWGSSVQGSYGIGGGTIQGSDTGKPTGGGGGGSVGKAGISAGYGKTFAIKKDYSKGKCNVKPGPRTPCCQCYRAGMEIECYQGKPSFYFTWVTCSGHYLTYSMTTGKCDGKRCR